MAKQSSKKSNNYQPNQSLASCYIVDGGITAFSGLQYGSTGERSGMPEVGTGIPEPPSPALNAAIKEHLRGQALTVAKLCEREFCGTLKAAFLGERKSSKQDSLATGVAGIIANNSRNKRQQVPLEAYIEILDYVGGNDFHGFIAKTGVGRGLFVFFGEELLHKDLKAGIVAILELAGIESMEISQVVACVDRKMPESDLQSLTRNLGWIGFEMTTLAPWTDGVYLTSEDWLLLGVEV